MKLLIIHNKYQSRNIGGEDIVYQNELVSLQKELGKDNVYSYEVSNDGMSKMKLLFTIWFSFKYYKEIKNIVKENSIDVVHVHNFYPLLTPSVFKAAKDAGAKVVHTLHNYRLWCISGIFYRDNHGVCELCTKNKFSFFGIVNKCIRKSFVQSTFVQVSFWFYKITKIFNTIDYFFVLTEFQKHKVISLGIDEKKIILKPNSLDMAFDRGIGKKDDYIYVGRLEESKGIFELLEIWETLGEKYILSIIGGGDIEEELREKYNKTNIIFRGKCSREDTLSYISKSKYLIQSSLWYETFGLTIIEAMSFGVPVIGFNIGTRSDFIENDVNGFLSSKDNLKSIIEKSFGYPEYDTLSTNAIVKAQKFSNKYVINEQIEIYKKILEDRV